MATEPLPLAADEPPDDSSPERIAPAEGNSAAELHARLETGNHRPRSFDTECQPFDPPSADWPLQFSLRDLLTTVSIVSVELAGLHWMLLKDFAGLAGVAALGWLIWRSLFRPESPLALLLCWALFAVYLLSLCLALVAPSG